MVQESLLNYIRTQVSNGQRLDAITSILLQQGFSQQEIDQTYTQLGYVKSNQLPPPSTPRLVKQTYFLPVVITVLALFVLLILGTFAFSTKKNKSTVFSSYPITPVQTTHAISQTLPNCSDHSHWITSSETSFNAAIYLKTVSIDTCEYTDPALGYTVQFPANWYINFSPSYTSGESTTIATSSGVTSKSETQQPSHFISFESQQLSATNKSLPAEYIYITSSKTNYSDIISYMGSIQQGPAKLDETIIDQNQNIYKIVSVGGQKGIQLQYTVGKNVGIDTKFISNGVLYDVTFNSVDSNAFNANKQYYTNLLNSFTLKPA